MNEQRQQAYLNLIGSLLDSPSGEESEILAGNQELLDAGFVQKVEEVAQMCSQHGDEKTANWLQSLAMQLGEGLNLDNKVDLQSLSEEEIETYYQFLMEVLQATADSEGNSQVVYPLLAKNTDKLDGVFAEILRQWGTNTLGEAKADEAEYLAAVIVEFSNLIQQFPLGNKASNMEIAITGYEVTLTVRTREALPQSWATIQNNLAIAYSDRIKGDRADNIDQAIAAYTAALTVRTREALPQDWAATQNNLANAYSERIKGDRADNIEQAIAAFTVALTVYTREALPQQWATIQNNLAAAYSNRSKGDKADNIEQAIAAYTAALTVRTLEALPIDWAMTQNNLANAYYSRIKGDRADNIENAIAASTAALTVRTREALPQDWAGTQNNLAAAYSERIKGDRADNIEQAIAAFTAALTVYTREALPQYWAMTQHNLAAAYRDRIKGDKADNIENAIAAFTAALTVYTREALPENHAETLFGLGIVYQDANKFDLAYNAFKSAIDTIESLREEIVSGEESKRKQAEQFNKVYSRMVEVCWQLNKITAAIEYVERSKTRNLVEQILIRDSKTIFLPEDFTQLEKYRDEIAVGQYQIQNGKAENPKVLAQHLQELRQQRNELQNRYLPVGYGFKFDSFQPTLNEHTAIIEWYILNDKILAFIITKTTEVKVWQSQPEDREALYDWVNQYLQNYKPLFKQPLRYPTS